MSLRKPLKVQWWLYCIILDYTAREGMETICPETTCPLNSVEEIRALVSVKHWKHCPGAVNHADIPSHAI